jgi:hypothetical protein
LRLRLTPVFDGAYLPPCWKRSRRDWAQAAIDIRFAPVNSKRWNEDSGYLQQLAAAAGQSTGVPTDNFEEGTQQNVAQNDSTSTSTFGFSVAASSPDTSDYVLDPPGPDLTLSAGAGSPSIGSLTLSDDAASYLVSFETGTTWSAQEVVAPGSTLGFNGEGVDGLRIAMLGTDLDPTDGIPQFSMFLTFSSSGTFTATTTSFFPGDDRFNGDPESDILIENTAGAVVVGELGSSSQIGYSQVGGLGPEWSFRGTGDFLGDGNTGFVIENTAGAVVVGESSNGATSYTQVAALGPEWTFEGAGDYLAAGDDQFLIENTAGAVVVGEIVSGQAQYTQVAGLGPEWRFVGSGDFLGDGQSQFLIENSAGAVAVGEVVNGLAQYTQVAALGPEWTFQESGDFLGDGKTDFLIENTAGAVVVGEVINGQATYITVGGLGPEWRFVGEGDYSGTGVDSFLIENSSGAVVTGAVVSGLAQYAQIAALGPEWSFHG